MMKKSKTKEPEDNKPLTKQQIIKERKILKEYFGIDYFMECPSMEELETHAIEMLLHDAKEPDSEKRILSPKQRKSLIRFVRNN